MKRRILVGLVLVVAVGVAHASVEGTWRGTLRGPGFELPLVFHLERDGDGGWAAALDSPDQGAFGLQAAAVAWDRERLRLDFPALADHLARAGVAALRFDDRGVGGSGGDPAQATTPDLARDAAAALAWLRARPCPVARSCWLKPASCWRTTRWAPP